MASPNSPSFLALVPWRPLIQSFMEELELQTHEAEERRRCHMFRIKAHAMALSWQEQVAQHVASRLDHTTLQLGFLHPGEDDQHIQRLKRRRQKFFVFYNICSCSSASSLMPEHLRATAPAHLDNGYTACDPPFYPGKGFKNHDSHSAHTRRFYYLLFLGNLRGTYTSLSRIVHIVIDTSVQHDVRDGIQLQSFKPTPDVFCTFSLCDTGDRLYLFRSDADEESHRSGAREVRVVRTFEEAVKTLQLDAGPASGTADLFPLHEKRPMDKTTQTPRDPSVNYSGCEAGISQELDVDEGEKGLNEPRHTAHSAEEWEQRMDALKKRVLARAEVLKLSDEEERELKGMVLDELRANAPHSKELQGWVDDYQLAEPPPRSAEEIQRGRDELSKRVIAREDRVDTLNQACYGPRRGPKPLPAGLSYEAVAAAKAAKAAQGAGMVPEPSDEERARAARLGTLMDFRYKSSKKL
ncbi:hypothetical protein C8R44DRAFT_736148 [Mycena epipterygia]|nr:hypothetical protein C8R44DRAFT_736148 [Mycena epipterygia]